MSVHIRKATRTSIRQWAVPNPHLQMKTHPPRSLALSVAFLLIIAAPAITHADFTTTDCSAPVANGGLGFCGPSQVRDLLRADMPFATGMPSLDMGIELFINKSS